MSKKMHLNRSAAQVNNISPMLQGDTIKMGMKMYKWGMMVWLKGENCIKQLQELYIHIGNPQGKQSLDQISYQEQGCLVWKHIYSYVKHIF